MVIESKEKFKKLFIGKSVVNPVQNLITLIKQKKELRYIDDAFIVKELTIYFKQNPKLKREVEENFNEKSKTIKLVVKDIRAVLRRVYGLFRDEYDPTKREKILQTFLDNQTKENMSNLLKTHSSTKERIATYEKLYQKIFSLTNNPTTILDLGCGINPLSSFFFEKNVTYHAYDLSKSEIDLLNSFFSNVDFVQGKAQILDLFDTKKIERLPKADVAFAFKVADVLDRNKGHKQTEHFLKAIPSKYVVLSFATKTMSGKKMTSPRRPWMMRLCDRLCYKYDIREYENEIFYVIEK